MSTSQAYWVTLALISNIANYLKYNYFLDCDAIDNLTLRLWKFSDFCSRHTVGVAGDNIMFHILVIIISGSFEVGGGEKSSRHSRRMRNPQFCVSGKRPVPWRHISSQVPTGITYV